MTVSTSVVKTATQIRVEHEAWLDRQPTTQRCAWCPWKFSGTAGEARDKAAEHRRDAHPDRQPRSRDQIAKQQKREREDAARRQREEATLARKPLERKPIERMTERAPRRRWAQWAREDAIAALLVVAAELGHPPSANQAKKDKRLPSNPTICKMFGTYGNFIVAGGFPRPTRATRYSTPSGPKPKVEAPPAAPAATKTDQTEHTAPWLVAFLYTLLRDELPVGVVERIVRDIEKAGRKRFLYSNEHLAGYANEIGDRLLQSTP